MNTAMTWGLLFYISLIANLYFSVEGAFSKPTHGLANTLTAAFMLLMAYYCGFPKLWIRKKIEEE